jgi:hypothetical protein
MVLALEQIRRMRGGAQAQLMRCSDDGYYVVKFQNNPQGTRILANELLATRLAARIGLPTPVAAVVEVREELIEQTQELVIELGRGRSRCNDHVAAPHTRRGGIVENTRSWIRARMNDVFRRHRILGKLERSVRVEEFTEPGDPLRIDYAYHYNGTRGYLQTIALGRDTSQAKVLAYTAECIRARAANSEFTAITEIAPAPENPRHQFVARLFETQHISIVPLNRLEKFADGLRPRLQ